MPVPLKRKLKRHLYHIDYMTHKLWAIECKYDSKRYLSINELISGGAIEHFADSDDSILRYHPHYIHFIWFRVLVKHNFAWFWFFVHFQHKRPYRTWTLSYCESLVHKCGKLGRYYTGAAYGCGISADLPGRSRKEYWSVSDKILFSS